MIPSVPRSGYGIPEGKHEPTRRTSTHELQERRCQCGHAGKNPVRQVLVLGQLKHAAARRGSQINAPAAMSHGLTERSK